MVIPLRKLNAAPEYCPDVIASVSPGFNPVISGTEIYPEPEPITSVLACMEAVLNNINNTVKMKERGDRNLPM
jgi:hypothetical protein